MAPEIRHIMLAISRFDVALRQSSDGIPAKLSSLARALDGLVDAYYETSDVEPGDGERAPCLDYYALRAIAERSFPNLGYYADTDPTGEIPQEPMVGDAIDDLADISGDLSRVKWYADHRRADAAIWEFRFGYQVHWGNHLHDLRRYLHRVIYAD